MQTALTLLNALQVLNLLLHKLTRRPYDTTLLDFLFVDEHLVDIGDDLVDYEVRHMVCTLAMLFGMFTNVQLLSACALQDDVMANSFNIYRGATPHPVLHQIWSVSYNVLYLLNASLSGLSSLVVCSLHPLVRQECPTTLGEHNFFWFNTLLAFLKVALVCKAFISQEHVTD